MKSSGQNIKRDTGFSLSSRIFCLLLSAAVLTICIASRQLAPSQRSAGSLLGSCNSMQVLLSYLAKVMSPFSQHLVTPFSRSWSEGGMLQGIYDTSLSRPAALCHSSMTAVGHFPVLIPKSRHRCPGQQRPPLSAVVQAGPFSVKHPIFEKGCHQGALKYSRKLPGHNTKGFLTHGLCGFSYLF